MPPGVGEINSFVSVWVGTARLKTGNLSGCIKQNLPLHHHPNHRIFGTTLVVMLNPLARLLAKRRWTMPRLSHYSGRTLTMKSNSASSVLLGLLALTVVANLVLC